MVESQCPKCVKNDFPSDAYSCIICKIFVHDGPPCSFEVDGQEQIQKNKRICYVCHRDGANPEGFINIDLHENWGGQVSKQTTTKKKEIPLPQPCAYSLSKTCAFDSIFQILYVGYLDFPEIKSYVDTKHQDITIFSLIQEVQSQQKLCIKTYQKRFTILEEFFSATESVDRHSMILNCAATIVFMLSRLFKSSPSFKEDYKCPNCGYESHYLIKNARINWHGLSDIFEEIKNFLATPPKPCLNKCGANLTKSIVPGEESYFFRQFQKLKLIYTINI